jgi:hypothetical protein
MIFFFFSLFFFLPLILVTAYNTHYFDNEILGKIAGLLIVLQMVFLFVFFLGLLIGSLK